MQCITPLTLKNPIKGQSFPIPCGKCPICVKKRQSQWSFRLRQEAEVSYSAFFITLTYNSECLPLTKRGYPTLKPEHVTLFLKRLRKRNTKKIKYYYVGEYGSKTRRPHYHMLLFNAEIETIEQEWKHGTVHYGKVEGASIGYTLKYMCKEASVKKYKQDNSIPEFARMSKGLGSSYLTPNIINYHNNKNYILERICMQQDGKRISMPRYYKEKIYNETEKLVIQYQAKKLSEQQYIDNSESIDLTRQIEAHKSLFNKMEKEKYKNKFL